MLAQSGWTSPGRDGLAGSDCTMRSPQEELKPGAGREASLPFVCVPAGLCSLACNMAKQMSKGTGDRISCLRKHQEKRGSHQRWAGVCTQNEHGHVRDPVGSDSPASPQPLPLLHVAVGRAVRGTGLSQSSAPSGRLGGRAAAVMAKGFDTMPREVASGLIALLKKEENKKLKC